jgi:hypothetical protein
MKSADAGGDAFLSSEILFISKSMALGIYWGNLRNFSKYNHPNMLCDPVKRRTVKTQPLLVRAFRMSTYQYVFCIRFFRFKLYRDEISPIFLIQKCHQSFAPF